MEVERLLGVSRELHELRDGALVVAVDDDNNRGVLTIEPGLRELWRSQTLVVLEFTHDRFDEARDLEPSELRAAASVFRDAIAVLDAIGWLAGEQDVIHAQVAVTAGHLEQLERVRVDVAMSVIDSLKVRDDEAAPDEIARIDQRVREARLTVLILHPTCLGADELRREMLADRHDFTQTDAHDRAVRDLVACGLLRRDGDSVIPTRAAVRFHELHG